MRSTPRSYAGRLADPVDNVVREPDAGYPWPVPTACFALFALPADGLTGGRWLPTAQQEVELGERHWWPLVAPGADVLLGHGH